MTREEAIKFASHAQSLTDLPEVKEFYALAESALREQEERENPKPLTLDELLEMDGEPVWIRAKHYGIYADIVNIMGKEDGERRVHFSINYRLQENGCGKTWLAYRNKPKEDEL